MPPVLPPAPYRGRSLGGRPRVRRAFDYARRESLPALRHLSRRACRRLPALRARARVAGFPPLLPRSDAREQGAGHVPAKLLRMRLFQSRSRRRTGGTQARACRRPGPPRSRARPPAPPKRPPAPRKSASGPPTTPSSGPRKPPARLPAPSSKPKRPLRRAATAQRTQARRASAPHRGTPSLAASTSPPPPPSVSASPPLPPARGFLERQP